jgi:MFS transporter, putative metabolite:H+ symporter
VKQDAAIAGRLDRLPITRMHRLAVVVVGLGMFFDLYEVFLTGTLSTALQRDFHVGSGQLKPLLASAFVGMFIGAVVLSRIADRLGRRRAFFLTLAVYSFFSVLGAFSPNVGVLVTCRFLAGLGIGGELPLCDAYLSDLLPARVRGRLIGWAYTVGFCGVPLAGFLALGVVPHSYLGLAGWRWMFLIGGVGAAICWILRRALPESPRWLDAVGRQEEADAIVCAFESEARKQTGGLPLPQPSRPAEPPQKPATLRTLVVPPWRSRTVMLVVFQILQVFGYYGFGTLAPLVLASKGYDVVHSLMFSALSFVGYPVGSLLSVPVLERIERKYLIMLSALAMLGFGLGFGYSHATAAIVVCGFCYTVASNLFSNAYHVYQGELFPTRLRATGAGAAYSLSRLASAAMPYILLPLLTAHGPNALFVFIACAMAAVILDIGLLGPRTTGRSLEELSAPGGTTVPDTVTSTLEAAASSTPRPGNPQPRG